MTIQEARAQLCDLKTSQEIFIDKNDPGDVFAKDCEALAVAIESLNDIGAACRMLYDAIEATYKPTDVSCGEWLKYNAGKALDLIKKYQDEEEVQFDD